MDKLIKKQGYEYYIPILGVHKKHLQHIGQLAWDYKFHFDENNHNLLTIEDVMNELFYDIWWFQQIRGQCMHHSLYAILQSQAPHLNLNYHQRAVIFQQQTANVIANTGPHSKIRSTCDCNGEQLKLNNINIEYNEPLYGSFSTCSSLWYLVNEKYEVVRIAAAKAS